MTVSKETLLAYVDDELSAEERATVEAAMTLDTEIAHEIERQQLLRQRLHGAFDDVLKEPVPERLVAAARNAPIAAAPATTKVADIAHARRQPAATARRWALPEWGAMAACLIVGLFVGYQLLPATRAPVALENGALVARGQLESALASQLASQPSAGDAIRVPVSFRDRDGRYCRTFAMNDARGLAGLACNEGDRWRVQIMTESAHGAGQPGGYRTAAGDLPPVVMQAVQERIDGEPLDAAGESAARAHHWR